MRRKIISFLLSLFVLVTASIITEAHILTASEDRLLETNAYLIANLSINPASYDSGEMIIGDVDFTTFEVWNSGCCYLQYEIIENCSWVTISPTAGSSGGEHDIITVFIETNFLDPGFHQCDIHINSDHGKKDFHISVNCSRADIPKATISPRSYDFGNQIKGTTPSTSFDVWNCGIDTLSYSFINIPASYHVSPMSGTSTGEHDTITLTINTSTLPTGVYTEYLQITSSGGDIFFICSLNIKSPVPELSYSPHAYNFGYKEQGETDRTTFEIWNSGIKQLTYSLVEECDWITIDPTTGYSSGEHDTITVSIDTTDLWQRSYSYDIAINTNAGTEYFTVTVFLGEGYTNITVDQAWDFVTNTSNGIQIPIDVRYDNEWAVEHIDTPAPENPRHHCSCAWADEAILQEFIGLYQGKEIILYCLAGSRSLTAANMLIEHNFNGTIYLMVGGITAWKQAGYPTKANMPPNMPVITGDVKGKPGEEYHYTVMTTDVDADDVYYYVNWSDNTTNQLVGPYHSGEEITLNHTWVEKGTYVVKVKARDIYGSESDYATLEIKMPKISTSIVYQFLVRIFEHFFKYFLLFTKISATT